MEVELRDIGDAVAFVLPKEALAHLKVEAGDKLSLSETPNGYQVSPSQSEFAKTMTVMESLAKRYSNTLRDLAK